MCENSQTKTSFDPVGKWQCADNHFKCLNGPCLNQSLVCNKRIDCHQGWNDEDPCSEYHVPPLPRLPHTLPTTTQSPGDLDRDQLLSQ